MSETKDTDDTNKQAQGARPLSLRRSVESGHVRQNFSHGRSRSVVVEKKRKRAVAQPGKTADKAAEAKKPAPAPAKKPAPAAAPPAAEEAEKSAAARSGMVLRTLTEEEKDARAQALASSRVREAQEREQAVIDAKRREEEEQRAHEEAERAAQLKAEEEARQTKQAEKPTKAPAKAETATEDASAARRKRARAEEQKPSPGRKSDAPRRRGKLTIANALDDAPRQRSLASIRRQREREKKQASERADAQGKISREVTVPEAITIQELANRMAERAVDVIKYLMKQGQMVKINDVIDADTAQLIAEEFGHTAKRVSEADVEEGLSGPDDDPKTLKPRAPVVTVMGHVDHGKTSLLDALREAKVTAGEAGGITQHIGAYQIETDGGQKITFLDTPGHEAFTAMRARGTQVTDLVILVVAADDGVMPQTVEAINHAKAAEVPMILAINKIDKPDGDPSRVRTELLQHEIVLESMGGEVLEVEVSATEKTNLDKLLEAILLQAELLDLTANPDRPAEGVVVEARLDRGRGPVGSMLVQRGTLQVGDIVVAGAEWGKVRALINDHGENIEEAGPAVPVEVLGLNGAPDAGDQFAVVETEARAREIAEYRQRKRREMRTAGAGERASLEHMMTQLKETGVKEFPILIKADVQGSAEAIVGALDKLGTDEVKAGIVHAGVGGITESDISLAAASNAVILGFNVRANAQARDAAEAENLEIRYYNVIYNLVDDVKAAMSGLLDPALREHFLGNAEILEVFTISKVGDIAGCRVTEGIVRRGANVRLIRDDVVIHEGRLSTLKRFKDEVREVNAGQECGMAFENYHDLKQGDVIECFETEEVERSL